MAEHKIEQLFKDEKKDTEGRVFIVLSKKTAVMIGGARVYLHATDGRRQVKVRIEAPTDVRIERFGPT